MGLIVLDTSVLVDHLGGTEAATAALVAAGRDGHRMVASTLTRIELLAGMRSNERRSVRTLLDSLAWIGVTEEIAQRAGTLARQHRASHPGIGVVDVAIAATALVLGASLWTLTVRHFPMLPDLTSPY